MKKNTAAKSKAGPKPKKKADDLLRGYEEHKSTNGGIFYSFPLSMGPGILSSLPAPAMLSPSRGGAFAECSCAKCEKKRADFDARPKYNGWGERIEQDPGKISAAGAALMEVSRPTTTMADLVIQDSTRRQVDQALQSYRKGYALHKVGLPRARKMLFTGPPGTGKTMTAQALANATGLPLVSVKTDQVVSMWLGGTEKNLRIIFDEMKRFPGVYFFDEFDSIGQSRTSGRNHPGLARTLNSILVMMEADDSEGLMLFATNLDDTLDDALHRRFDFTVRYELPTKEMYIALMKERTKMIANASIDWDVAAKAAHGLGHGDVGQACNVAVRDAVLADQEAINTMGLCSALAGRHRKPKAEAKEAPDGMVFAFAPSHAKLRDPEDKKRMQ